MKVQLVLFSSLVSARLLSREESSVLELKEQLRSELREEMRAEMHQAMAHELDELKKTMSNKMRQTVYRTLLGTTKSDTTQSVHSDDEEEGCNPLHFKMNVDPDQINYNMNCLDATNIGASCTVIEKVGWNCDSVKVKCQKGNVYEQTGRCTNFEASGQRILRRCDADNMTLSKPEDELGADYDCSKAKREGDYCVLTPKEGQNCDKMTIACAVDGTYIVDGECEGPKPTEPPTEAPKEHGAMEGEDAH